ncbi:MAG: PAS domain S-box protein [Candidatus Cloacimonetes bacterium]|nr:PAS domain S-box protein [Candidatus Cloacimonadota bacterium]
MEKWNIKSALFIAFDHESSDSLSEVLIERGYQIFRVSNLSEALNILETEKIELVFIDTAKQSDSAKDVLVGLNSEIKYRDIVKIIIASPLEIKKSQEEYDKLGAYGYIIKPMSQRLISISLDTLIDQLESNKQSGIRRQDYSLLFNNFRDAILVANTNRQIIDCNPAFEELFGYRLDELRGKQTVSVYASEEDYKNLGTSIQDNKDSKGNFNYIVHYRKKDGTVFSGETSVFFKQDDKGNILAFVGSIRDVTERIEGEKALEISLTKYMTLFNSLPIGVTVADEEGKIIERNLMAENLLGISEEKKKQLMIDGKSWKIIRPDGTELPPEEFARVRALKENKLVENVEMGIVKETDDVTWLNVSATPIPLEGYGVVIAFNDITERKQIEAKLKESEAFIINTGEVASVGGWEVDLVNQTVYWSDITRKIHEVPEGYQPTVEEAVKFFPGESREKLTAAMEKAINEGEGYELELEFVSAKGNHRWIKTLGTPVMQEGKCVRFHGVFQDITNQKRSELKLAKYQENLEKLVVERTQELEEANQFLQKKNKDLEEMHKLFIGREFRINELRDELALLKGKLNPS